MQKTLLTKGKGRTEQNNRKNMCESKGKKRAFISISSDDEEEDESQYEDDDDDDDDDNDCSDDDDDDGSTSWL